jgi:hypothetical protein
MGILLRVHKQFHRLLREQSLSQRHGPHWWNATRQMVKAAKRLHLRVQRA